MNQTPAPLATLALAASLLAGCGGLREVHDAFLDRASPLAPLSTANLGQTPRDEILRQLGEPDEIDARRLDSRSLEVAYYFDDYVDGEQQPRYKFLALEFGKGALTAYSFHDTGVPAKLGFEDADRAKLVKGKSTRREVENALGVPSAKALLPTTITLPALDARLGGAPFPLAAPPEGAKEAWQYYTEGFDEARRDASRQTLTVFFDERGVLIGDALLHELVSKAP